jgi:putative FmdB family regulatory protein
VPLFDYRCRACGAVSEVFLRMQEERDVRCERCASPDVLKLVSRFSFKATRAAKYDETFREKMLPFLKTQPGAREALAEGSGSEEARAFELTEQIGERVDATLDQHVFRNL